MSTYLGIHLTPPSLLSSSAPPSPFPLPPLPPPPPPPPPLLPLLSSPLLFLSLFWPSHSPSSSSFSSPSSSPSSSSSSSSFSSSSFASAFFPPALPLFVLAFPHYLLPLLLLLLLLLLLRGKATQPMRLATSRKVAATLRLVTRVCATFLLPLFMKS